VIITANPKASSRTKNRLREHGQEFVLVRLDTPVCFAGRQSALVLAPDGWKGWLPLDELEALNENR
jgi:hypothetical protein